MEQHWINIGHGQCKIVFVNKYIWMLFYGFCLSLIISVCLHNMMTGNKRIEAEVTQLIDPHMHS